MHYALCWAPLQTSLYLHSPAMEDMKNNSQIIESVKNTSGIQPYRVYAVQR